MMSRMSQSDDVTPGGSHILRHEPQDECGWTPPPVEAGAEEIERHVTEHFGEPSTVLHEILSEIVHLDIHVIKPRPDRNCWTLFTTGMSDRPMTTNGPEATRFAELMLSLPPDWRVDLLRLTPPSDDVEQWYWPIRWLKILARLPHEYGTWLGPYHTVPNGDPPEPFAADTRLCCWMLLPPVRVPADAREVTLADGRTVRLLVLHALYPEEMRLKLDKGSDALLSAFDRADLSEVLTPDRASVV
jgi:Suppressor of fused protein (SUFU)